MVAHFTRRTYGVNRTLWFVEGIWLHRKSRQIRFLISERPFLHYMCATWSKLPSYISTMVRSWRERTMLEIHNIYPCLDNRSKVRHHMFTAHHKVLKRRTEVPAHEEETKPFRCEECPKAFPKCSQLKNHVSLRHAVGPVPRPKFQCQDCGQLLATKTALKKHVTLHKPPGFLFR